MAKNEKNEDTGTTGDGGVGEVTEAVQKDQEQGFRGRAVDPTPDENYSVKGVTSGAPTPETDEEARKAASEATRRA